MNWKQTAAKPLVLLGLLFFSLYSLGQLQRIEFSSGLVLYAFDVIIGLFLMYWLLFAQGWKTVKQRLSTFQPSKATALWLIAIIWLVIGWIFNPLGLVGAGIGFLYVSRLVVYAVFTYVLATGTDWRWVQQELAAMTGRYPLLILFSLTGLAMMFLGYIQYVWLPDTRFLAALGWDDHYYRMIGTMLDPAFMGIILVLTFIGVQTIFVKKHQLLQTVLSVLLIVAVSLTFSRTSYLALAVAGSILWWARWRQKNQRWHVPALLLFFAACIFLTPKPGGEGVNLLRYSTIAARHETALTTVTTQTPTQWLIGRGMFVPKSPLVGVVSTQTIPAHARQPDLFLLTVTTGYGLLGWIIIGGLMYWYRSYWQRWPSWLWASFCAIIAASLFNNTLFQPFVWLWLTGIIWTTRSKLKGDR